MQMLREQLGQLARGATSEEQRAFDAMREARRAELEAQFGGQQRALDEEMAARGLYASSIGAGRLGDLRGQQARALASLEAEVLGKQAEMAAERQRTLVAGLQSATATQADIDIRAAQLQQDARLRGRELDIQSARDIAANQLGYAEIGSRERIAQAEVNQRAQQLQQEARLRGRELDLQSARDIAANQLGYAELTSREKISGAELAARERIANLDRELQRTLGMGGLGINRGSLMLQLYDAIGKSNIPPEAIDDIFRLLGLTPPPRTPVGTPGGTPGGPGTPGGNEDLNNPLTWRAGTYDGEPRATTDGRNFRWSVARGRWEQQTTLFG